MENSMDLKERPKDPKVEKILGEYNSKSNLLGTVIVELEVFLKEMVEKNDLSLSELIRVITYTMIRMTSSTYCKSETEFSDEMKLATKLSEKFYKDVLNEGEENANPDNFKFSRLVLFACTFLDNTVWRFYLQQGLMSMAEEEKEATEKEINTIIDIMNREG